MSRKSEPGWWPPLQSSTVFEMQAFYLLTMMRSADQIPVTISP